jgi:uncharacterized protein YndB with AHSA1/START domain
MDLAEVTDWLLLAVGFVAGIFALVVLVGAFLPRRHVVARAAVLPGSPQAVWEVVTDLAALPSWHKEVVGVERLPDRDERPAWRQTFKGNYPVLVETVASLPPRRVVWAIADEAGPFHGQWEFDLDPYDGGCRVTLTERGEIPNPFFRFMARLLMDPARYLERYLQALAVRQGGAAAHQTGGAT